MILNCNQGCTLNNGVTECKLDPLSNKVVCLYCKDEIVNISSYIVESMRSIGDLLRDKASGAFEFLCLKCNNRVRVDCSGETPVGKDCDDECNIKITDIMHKVIREHDENPS